MSSTTQTLPRPDLATARIGTARPSAPVVRHRVVRLAPLAAVLGALLLLVVADVVLNGPLRHVDELLAAASWHRDDHEGRSAVLAGWLAYAGQRAYSAPVLLGVAGYLAWRLRIRRPLVLAGSGLFALNAVVGAAKIFFGRSRPRGGVDLLWTHGVQFPSGHTANAVLTWGLTVYLLAVYLPLRRTTWHRLALGVVAISAAVSVSSLYLNTHWVSDLISGLLAGGLLLVGVVAGDRHAAPAGPAAGGPADGGPADAGRDLSAIEQIGAGVGTVGSGASGVAATDSAARSRIPV